MPLLSPRLDDDGPDATSGLPPSSSSIISKPPREIVSSWSEARVGALPLSVPPLSRFTKNQGDRANMVWKKQAGLCLQHLFTYFCLPACLVWFGQKDFPRVWHLAQAYGIDTNVNDMMGPDWLLAHSHTHSPKQPRHSHEAEHRTGVSGFHA